MFRPALLEYTQPYQTMDRLSYLLPPLDNHVPQATIAEQMATRAIKLPIRGRRIAVVREQPQCPQPVQWHDEPFNNRNMDPASIEVFQERLPATSILLEGFACLQQSFIFLNERALAAGIDMQYNLNPIPVLHVSTLQKMLIDQSDGDESKYRGLLAGTQSQLRAWLGKGTFHLWCQFLHEHCAFPMPDKHLVQKDRATLEGSDIKMSPPKLSDAEIAALQAILATLTPTITARTTETTTVTEQVNAGIEMKDDAINASATS